MLLTKEPNMADKVRAVIERNKVTFLEYSKIRAPETSPLLQHYGASHMTSQRP